MVSTRVEVSTSRLPRLRTRQQLRHTCLWRRAANTGRAVNPLWLRLPVPSPGRGFRLEPSVTMPKKRATASRPGAATGAALRTNSTGSAARPPPGQLPLAGALVVALGAAAAAWVLLGASSARWAEVEVALECGPASTEHFSEQPAQGLHVLQVEGGAPCEDGAATFTVSVHVDGCLLASPAEAASSWETGTVVDIDTEDGWDLGATVTGPATSGALTERQVRFADGTLDDWDTSDFRLVQRQATEEGGGGSTIKYGTSIELECAPPAGEGIQDWLVTPVRRLVPRIRPKLHAQLIDTGALRREVVAAELNSRPGLDRWAAFTPHGSPIPPSHGEIIRAFRECSTVYLIEGGQFVWPGVRVGHSWTVETSAASPVDSSYSGRLTVKTLSLQPRLFTVEPLLTKAERQWIIDQSPSAQAPGARTPKTTVKDVESLAVIERRMHSILRLPESHGEDVQIMKYTQGDACTCPFLRCTAHRHLTIAYIRGTAWLHASLWRIDGLLPDL